MAIREAFMLWRKAFVNKVYATHNKSPQIGYAINNCLSRLKNDQIGLNVGAGYTQLHPSIVNLDMALNSNLDCGGQGEYLPFATDTFALIVSQETLEHTRDPNRVISEMYRVLTPDGTLYCQVPFTIGYHPGPTDFWRFSREGVQEVVEKAGFVCEEVHIAVGPATGFYRILVEFLAISLSLTFSKLYHPFKAVLALLLYPIKWLDPLLQKSKQADRIAGGYYVIARKRN